MKSLILLLAFYALFVFASYAGKTSAIVSKQYIKCMNIYNRGSENDLRLNSNTEPQKKTHCAFHKYGKHNCRITLCAKLFIGSLAILTASGILTILEFTLIEWMALFAAIGWLLFGVGTVMAVMVIILGLTNHISG